jgi:hypothetical protein
MEYLARVVTIVTFCKPNGKYSGKKNPSEMSSWIYNFEKVVNLGMKSSAILKMKIMSKTFNQLGISVIYGYCYQFIDL